jgi:hypothetical protein
MTANSPVTVAHYPTEAEAVMAMNYLEQNGIKSWLAGGASGKTRVPLGQMLQVAPEDAERANRLLGPIIRRGWRRFLTTSTGLPPPRWMRRTITALLVVIAIWFLIAAIWAVAVIVRMLLPSH